MPLAAATQARSEAPALPRALPSRPALVLLAALWLVVAGNLPFWDAVWQAEGGLREGNALFLLSLPLFVLAWIYVLLSLLAWGRATRAVLGVVLMVSAAVGYFAHTYGMLLDDRMIANVAQTHAAEALDLVTWRLAGWLAAFGALPALLIARMRVASQPWGRELGEKVLGIVIALAYLAGALLVNFQGYASLLRNHRELRLMLVPYNVAAAARGYVRQRLAVPAALEVVGADATLAAVPAGKPKLTLLVIGETARAANFSLNGYARDTNPELARQGVISFADVSSCGTATAVSLPCMFLDVGRARYDDALAQRREGLLDVLQRAGVRVRWRDNNSGCKGVCDRVPYEDLSRLQVPGLCDGGECRDGVLLHGLQEMVDGLDGDAVIVLHMNGSHGPAYYKRYPREFEAWAPVCGSSQLDRCSKESIVNTYDNTLRYTDHVLSQAIDLLRGNARRFDTALLYVSDHGESLGEGGLYLHGMPYALAPREQTRVPMVLWLSDGIRRQSRLDAACLAASKPGSLSHDNLFHSVLGLAGVRTSVYRQELDLFHPCRS